MNRENEQNTAGREAEQLLRQRSGENSACGGKSAAVRDFLREVKELADQYPEVQEMFRSGGKLPGEVVLACAGQNVPLRVAYAEYEAGRVKAELEQLRRENETLKQNAAARAKAPVKGTAAGGGTDLKGKDPFLEGLLSDD